MPCYAKLLKELLTNMSKLEEVSTVILSEECSSIVTNKVMKKEKGPKVFIIPCTIKGFVNEKALADLGTSIDLMSYKIF